MRTSRSIEIAKNKFTVKSSDVNNKYRSRLNDLDPSLAVTVFGLQGQYMEFGQ